MTSGKGKTIGMKNRLVVGEFEERGQGVHHQEIFRVMEFSVWYCDGAHIILCICQNVKKKQLDSRQSDFYYM